MKPAAADLDVDVAAGAAGELDAVDPADVIDRQHLALGRAAVAQFLRRDRSTRSRLRWAMSASALSTVSAAASTFMRVRLIVPKSGSVISGSSSSSTLNSRSLAAPPPAIQADHVDLRLQRRAQAALGQHLLGGLADRLLQHFGGHRAAVALAHHRHAAPCRAGTRAGSASCRGWPAGRCACSRYRRQAPPRYRRASAPRRASR